MKKLILLAAIVVASSALYAAPDKKKKKAAAEAAAQPQPTVLTSASDTLSYAAGQAYTRGLIEYLTAEYKVDTAYMADVVAGFRDAVAKDTSDPKANAYAAGTQIAQMVKSRMLPAVEKQFEGTEHTIDAQKFYEGFAAATLADSTVMPVSRAVTLYETMRKADTEKAQLAWKSRNEQWLKENSAAKDVVTLPSGLQYKVITEGKGPKATATSDVTVKYEGRLIDGTVFDSSYKRNPQTTEFRADRVIKGWTEALTMMPEGSKWELYIPQELGYGSRSAGPTIKPYSTLIFTVELVKVKAEEPKAAPEADKKGAVTPAKKLTPAAAKGKKVKK